MGRFIVKITDEKTKIDFYLEWSTIVEAPVTYGMPLDDFRRYYQEEYGLDGMRGLDERLDRANKMGTSAYPPFDKLEDTLRTYDLNRDKVGDQREFILDNYCRNWKA